jgi:hypothetical protein
VGGLPVGFALTGAEADERQTLLEIFDTDPPLTADRPGQSLIGDKNYHGAEFEAPLAQAGLRLPPPARKGETERAGSALFKPLRQTIESINQTFKSQLASCSTTTMRTSSSAASSPTAWPAWCTSSRCRTPTRRG